MSDIQSYIAELKIKKVIIGGFDKEAVYTAMQELCSMYQKEIIQLKAEKEQLGAEKEQLKAEKKQLEIECKATANELDQANKNIQLLKIQLEEEQKSQDKYNLRFNALTQAIDAINADKEKIIEESKKTAEGIIAEANEKFESISQDCLFQKQQRDLILTNISDVKQRFSISTENLRSMLTKMLFEVDFLQKDGLWQTLSGNEINHLVPKMAGSVSEHDGR